MCVFGCKPKDKGSVDNTWVPRALKTGNLEVISQAEVKRIVLKNEKEAGSVEYQKDGVFQSLSCSSVVVAAGSLESPYLLKNSRQKFAPNGIGNRHVGRNLLSSISLPMLVSTNQKNGHSGIPIDLLIEDFLDEGILLVQGRNLGGITGPVSLAKFYARNFGPVGLRQWMRRHYQSVAVLTGFIDSDSSFNFGINNEPRKGFSIEIGNESRIKLKRVQDMLLKWARSANAQVLAQPSVDNARISGAMLRGTCRIGDNPEESAVDTRGKLHGYKNIYISDASLLGGGVIAHPSYTIQVLGRYFGKLAVEEGVV